MDTVLGALAHFAATTPTHIALTGRNQGDAVRPNLNIERQLSYQALWQAVNQAGEQLKALGVRRLALKADNSIDWAIADLAAMAAGVVMVPVPQFFSAAQMKHLLDSAGIDALWGDWPDDQHPLQGFAANLPVFAYNAAQTGAIPVELPAETAKVTFTSGSTGQPKGVCLSQSHLDTVSAALAATLRQSSLPERHLILLPLATLLENIAGIYVPLMLGMTTTILPGQHVGLTGSSRFDPQPLIAAMQQYQPQSLVLTPALLLMLNQVVRQFPALAAPLKFVAVGGARVSPQLLAQSHQLGIPAYEGYGLSECGSVVSLNHPGAHKAGSCGQVLPHCRVTVNDDGEVLVEGATMLGYIGDNTTPQSAEPQPAGSQSVDPQSANQRAAIATGDLGALGPDGFLHITGRKKNVLITPFGRNVSPEWLESEARHYPGLHAMVVIGDHQDNPVAVVSGTNEQQAVASLHQLNQTLPDYARIHQLILAPALSQLPALLTPNGRPRREPIRRYVLASLPGSASHTRNPIHVIDITNQEHPMTPVSSTNQSTPFFEHLKAATEPARQLMYTAPVFAACAHGDIERDTYIAFLTQAYHHVKHTVPLLMACGARLPEHYEWLRQALGEYIEEEKGHHEWIINDLAACGADTDSVRHSQDQGAVSPEIELMVAYLYHQIDRRNPMAFFGMVWVLEGTSVSVGGQVAEAIQHALQLPDAAMSYLKSHSSLDQEHIQLFEGLMNQMTDPVDQQAVIDGANMVFRLYGQMLHNLPHVNPSQVA